MDGPGGSWEPTDGGKAGRHRDPGGRGGRVRCSWRPGNHVGAEEKQSRGGADVLTG